MNLETQIKNKLKDFNLTESSIKLYLRNIKILNDYNEIKNFKFLENIEAIKDTINRKKDNTQRAYYISIVTILKGFTNIKKYKKLYDKYYKLMRDKAEEIKQKPTEVMTQRQKEAWVSWNELKELQNNLKEKVNNFKNDKEITENKYNTLLKYVILSLYLNNEPRRNEYALMKILKDNNESNNYNYIDLQNKNFIFNNYKTVKTYSNQIIKIDDELFNIIKLYLKFRPDNKDDYLFVYFNNKPLLSNNAITRILNSINPGLSSSLIRHIYISEKFGKLENQQTNTAYNMGHSKRTQIEYIKNNDI
jgi:integrase